MIPRFVIHWVVLAGILAVCSALPAHAASPDAFEPDNSFNDPSPDNPSVTLATPIGTPGGPKLIAPRVPQLHSLDTAGDITSADRDFVAFTLTAASDVLVQADVSVGPGLINLRLFNAAGTQLQFAQNANSSATTQMFATGLAAGTYFVGTEEVGLTSPAGAQTIETYFLTLLVNPPGQPFAPFITCPFIASGVGGAAFSFQLFAAGSGTIAYTVTGLPPGLGLNGTTIIGTAQQSGTFNATITASNGTAPNDTETLVVTINAFGIITGYAGTGAVGFTGDGGIATLCELGAAGPQGLAVDPSGNVLIADATNGRIRRVDGVSTIITTIAGSGQTTVADGGLGSAGILDSPSQSATDASGNVYIADTSNNRIRRWDAVSNIITTVAGSGAAGFSVDGVRATAASLNGPAGVAVNPLTGDLYFADTNNSVIRMIVTSNGNVMTVAGFVSNGKPKSGNSGDLGPATSAKLDTPSGIAFDAAGNLYIADTANNRIRKVDTTGTISNFAGNLNGAAGFTGNNVAATSAFLKAPLGVAVDPGNNNVYIADSSNNRIRSVNSVTLKISTIAGSATNVAGSSGDGGPATSALLNFPNSVAVHLTGVVIVADTNNNRIRQINVLPNTISTIAGTGVYSFTGDGGPAASATLSLPGGVTLAPSGTIYITDTNAQRVRQVSAGIITTIAGGGLPGDGGPASSSFLNLPEAIAVGSAGNIYFCDSLNGRVRMLNAASGNVTTIAGNGSNSFGGDGGPGAAASLNSPFGVAVDAAGNVYISDEFNNRVRMVNPAGTITTVAGNGTAGYAGDGGLAAAASLSNPAGLAVDASGNVLVADLSNNVIRKFTVGGNISTIAGAGTRGFAGDGGRATAALLAQPRAVAVDSGGNIFIADTGNSRVRRVDAVTGVITTVVGNGTLNSFGDNGAANVASLVSPLALAFDAGGSLYIADSGSHRVRRVSPAAAPAITSPATAAGTQNAFFSYLITGTGTPTPVFGATGLPAGLFFFQRQISGFPSVSGATDVTLTASNILGSATQNLRIILARAPGSPDTAPAFTSPPVLITISPNPGTTNSPMSFVAPSANDTDTDLLAFDWDFGDGNKGIGATTTHVYSTPGTYNVTVTATDGVGSISATGPAGVNDPSVTQALLVSKATFKFNFAKANADSVTLSGVIPVRTGFASNAQVVTLYIGTLKKTFTLNSKGTVTSKTDIIKLTLVPKPRQFLDAAKKFYGGKFSVTLKSQTLSSGLAGLGFVKNINTSTPLRVPLLMAIAADNYTQDITVVFSSTATSGTGTKLNTGTSIPGR